MKKNEWTPIELVGVQIAIISAFEASNMPFEKACAILCGTLFELCSRENVSIEKVMNLHLKIWNELPAVRGEEKECQSPSIHSKQKM